MKTWIFEMGLMAYRTARNGSSIGLFWAIALESRQLNTASTEQERAQIRAQLTAGCRPIGQVAY